MPIHNTDVADILNKIADLLEIANENPFRIRAYRNAALTISGLSREVADLVANAEDLSTLPGIGKDLAGKVEEIVRTGSLKQLAELQKETPGELTELMKVAQLGPKRVATLYKQLGIKDTAGLEKAAKAGKISSLSGFGKKTEARILEELGRLRSSETAGRTRLADAERFVLPLLEYLRGLRDVKRAEAAGSYRRRKETVGDIDILAISKRGADIIGKFTRFEDVDRVISKGKTRSTVILRGELQADLRVVPAVSFGAALHYFTGSKAHNVAIRTLGVKKGLKINEYGVFKGTKRVGGKTEEEVYAAVDLPYIEPELREDRGEIDAARKGKLPDLVTLEDIKGDLQSHTTASDGKNTLEEMARAAMDLGYKYLAITDHSKRVTMAGGLDEKRLAKEIAAIDKLNKKLKGFQLLKSCEVDILKDGSLDLSDDILDQLDLVICAIHYNFNLSREKQTERVLRAMENRHFNIMAHPTGRRIGEREPYDIDLQRVFQQAKDTGCYLEINSQPDRLDLADNYVLLAREMGLKLAISTDAHSIDNLNLIRYGIGQARRGWLEKQDVLNTRSWSDLEKLLKRG